jgi:hypothetical protein
MAGQEVTRNDFDYKVAQTLVAARNVVRDLETIQSFLERTAPGVDEPDPLSVAVTDGGKFGYDADETYLIRSTFQQLAGTKAAINPILDTARALTGLL